MAWYTSLAAWIDKRGGSRVIPRQQPDGSLDLYLKRYYVLKTPWIEVMIHQFFLSDEETLHDHPWDSASIILGGGYREHVLVKGKPTSFYRRPGYIGGRSRFAFHRVELEPGMEGKVWTVFITLARRRQWGFLTPEGWKPATVVFKERGIEQAQTDHTEYVGWLFPVRRGALGSNG